MTTPGANDDPPPPMADRRMRVMLRSRAFECCLLFVIAALWLSSVPWRVVRPGGPFDRVEWCKAWHTPYTSPGEVRSISWPWVGANIVSCAVMLVIISRVLRRIRRGKVDPGPRCRSCGYDMRACLSTRCPECGIRNP